jgi:hypothetical protein
MAIGICIKNRKRVNKNVIRDINKWRKQRDSWTDNNNPLLFVVESGRRCRWHTSLPFG